MTYPICGFSDMSFGLSYFINRTGDRMKHKTIISICLVFMLLFGSMNFSFAAEETAAEETAIVNLQTQGRVNPVGIDAPQPAFPGRCSPLRQVQPRQHTISPFRMKNRISSGIPASWKVPLPIIFFTKESH